MWFYPLKKLKQLNWQDYIYISVVGHIIIFLFLWLTPYFFASEKVIVINRSSKANISFANNTLKPIVTKKVIETKQEIKPIPKPDIKKPVIKKTVPAKKDIKPKLKENRKIVEHKKPIKKLKEIKKKITKPDKKKEIIKPVKEVKPKEIPKPEPIEEPKEIVLNLNEAELESSWMQSLKTDIINALDKDILEKIDETVIFSITIEKTGNKIVIDGLKNQAYYLALLKESLLKIKYPVAIKPGVTLKIIISGEKNG